MRMSAPPTKTLDGAFFEIDQSKLGPEGHKLLGGVDALMSAIAIFSTIRDRSTDIQERVFLQEVCATLMQGVDEHQVKLVEVAMAQGAGKRHEIPKDAPKNGSGKHQNQLTLLD